MPAPSEDIETPTPNLGKSDDWAAIGTGSPVPMQKTGSMSNKDLLSNVVPFLSWKPDVVLNHKHKAMSYSSHSFGEIDENCRRYRFAAT
jgi:hypothetical protein